MSCRMISAVSEFEIWLRVWSEHLRNLRAVYPVSSAKRWHCQFWQQIAVAHLPNLTAETTRCVHCVHGKMGGKYVTTTISIVKTPDIHQSFHHLYISILYLYYIYTISILYLYYIDLYWTSWNINPTESNWIQVGYLMFDFEVEGKGVTLQMAYEACRQRRRSDGKSKTG